MPFAINVVCISVCATFCLISATFASYLFCADSSSLLYILRILSLDVSMIFCSKDLFLFLKLLVKLSILKIDVVSASAISDDFSVCQLAFLLGYPNRKILYLRQTHNFELPVKYQAVHLQLHRHCIQQPI